MKPEKDSLGEIIRAVDNGVTDRKFWHSRTPQERVWAVLLMRQRKYGERAMQPIERVMKIVTLKGYEDPVFVGSTGKQSAD